MSNIVENVEVTLRGYTEGKACIHWQSAGARFHVWLDGETLEPEETVYKNPPGGIDYRQPGYFDTRRLDLNSKPCQRMYQAARKIADDQALWAKAKQAEANRKAEQQRENAAEARIARMQVHALEMYTLLCDLQVNGEGPDWLARRIAKLRAAIDKVSA